MSQGSSREAKAKAAWELFNSLKSVERGASVEPDAKKRKLDGKEIIFWDCL